jgi:chromate reductase, NAD(P)H dehydrogenase (quinone)
MTEPSFDVLALCGSLRRNSLNRRLLAAGTQLAPPDLRITLHPIGSIPPYDADVESRALPPPVRRLKEAVDASDGLLIVTPEYNTSIPGVLKNALDWVSRPAFRSPFVGKPVALMAATPGRRGTARTLDDLRRVLESTLAEPLPDAVDVAQAHEKLRGADIAEAALERQVRQLLEALAEVLRLRGETDQEGTVERRAAS